MNVDPFTSTIVNQAVVIFGGVALIGLALATAFGMYQPGKLQSAMELNLLPPPLDRAVLTQLKQLTRRPRAQPGPGRCSAPVMPAFRQHSIRH